MTNGSRPIKRAPTSEAQKDKLRAAQNAYIADGTMTFAHLEGWWTDAGTFESLLRASNLVAETRRRAEETKLESVGIAR